jgi:hypothetical protein
VTLPAKNAVVIGAPANHVMCQLIVKVVALSNDQLGNVPDDAMDTDTGTSDNKHATFFGERIKSPSSDECDASDLNSNSTFRTMDQKEWKNLCHQRDILSFLTLSATVVGNLATGYYTPLPDPSNKSLLASAVKNVVAFQSI